MGRILATLACAAVAATLAGCMEHVAPRFARSLKDTPPRPEVTIIDPAKAEKPQPEVNVIERARAEQSMRCGERHIEYGNGMLRETAEQKGVADAICGELHKYDYVR